MLPEEQKVMGAVLSQFKFISGVQNALDEWTRAESPKDEYAALESGFAAVRLHAEGWQAKAAQELTRHSEG